MNKSQILLLNMRKSPNSVSEVPKWAPDLTLGSTGLKGRLQPLGRNSGTLGSRAFCVSGQYQCACFLKSMENLVDHPLPKQSTAQSRAHKINSVCEIKIILLLLQWWNAMRSIYPQNLEFPNSNSEISNRAFPCLNFPLWSDLPTQPQIMTFSMAASWVSKNNTRTTHFYLFVFLVNTQLRPKMTHFSIIVILL